MLIILDSYGFIPDETSTPRKSNLQSIASRTNPVCRREASTCPIDHGERTNANLKSQPLYHRGAKGKMKRF